MRERERARERERERERERGREREGVRESVREREMHVNYGKSVYAGKTALCAYSRRCGLRSKK